MYQTTQAVEKILTMKKRLRIIQGGTGAGKTVGILLILIDMAQSTKGNKIISVVSETLPHLKKGAIRDFLNIMNYPDKKGRYLYRDEFWNKTDNIYTFETGNKIEFFGADQSDKVRGPRRDILFINEANNISYDTYTQLVIRTSDIIFLDYNPVEEFWVNTEILDKVDNDFSIITYKDNETLPDSIVKEIESRKDNKNFWQVFGLGQLGYREGKIYSDWRIVDEVPFEAKLACYGLDFGYTNDPTAIVAIYSFNGGYVLDEIAYDTGLSNKQIADIIKSQEYKTIVYADSAEPKSIDEIKEYGVNILSAAKGKDSVAYGIQIVQSQRISITKRSVSLIKDYRNYLWKTDKSGRSLNVPDHKFSHGPDAIRYGIVSSLTSQNKEEEFDKIYKRSTFYDNTIEMWKE